MTSFEEVCYGQLTLLRLFINCMSILLQELRVVHAMHSFTLKYFMVHYN